MSPQPMDKPTSSDPLPELLAFYQNANFLFRIALLIALFWPLAVIVTAILLKPHLAQTIVPLVDLVPLGAVFFLVLGAPFGIAIIIQNPAARRGLLWLAAAIGVELSIGVYFSTIPVSKDVGLIPLLLLTALAMFFLRVGGIGRTLIKLFAFFLFAITIVFVLGGRNRAYHDVERALSSPPFQPASDAQTLPASVRVDLRQPPTAQSTIAQSGSASQGIPQNAPRSFPAQTQDAFPPQPKPFRPNWAQAQQTAVEDYILQLAPCIRRAANVHCFFRIANTAKSVGAEIDSRAAPWPEINATRLIDDQGDVYQANSVTLGSSTGPSRAEDNLPPNVPVLASATFNNVAGTAIALVEIKVNLDDHFNHQIDVQFRNVSLEDQ